MGYLSASQITCINRCPREYAWKYLLKMKEPPVEALAYGSAFHRLTCGEDVDLSSLKSFDPDYPWKESLEVMLAGYREAMKTEPEPVISELEIATEEVKLIVDAILYEPTTEEWFIHEKKTAGKISEVKKRWLVDDVQMLMYVGNTNLIADKIALDPAKFSGVVYTQTLKPSERKKAKESPEEFANRLTSSTEVLKYEPWFFGAAATKLEKITSWASDRRDSICRMYEQSMDARSVPGNTSSCERYGRPCPYIDACFPCGDTVHSTGTITPEKE